MPSMKTLWTVTSFIVLFGSIAFAVSGIWSLFITKHSLDYIERLQANSLQCNQVILDGLTGARKDIIEIKDIVGTTTPF